VFLCLSVCFAYAKSCAVYFKVSSSSQGEFKTNWLALFQRLEVVIEEVNVEAGLEHCRYGLSPAKEVFDLIPIDPKEQQYKHTWQIG